jgi:hypothetical protein
MRTAAVMVCVGLVACSTDKREASDEKVSFAKQVKPLLSSICLPCHHSETLLGGLNLESRKTAFGGREGRAFLVPGEPDQSLIYLVTENPHGKTPAFEKMPAMENVFLSAEERALLRKWIEQGAAWPSGVEGWIKPLKIDTESS